MKNTHLKKSQQRRVTLFLCLTLCSLAFCATAAASAISEAWRTRLEARTATLWIEGQNLGDNLILNARAKLNVTWLERRLSRELETDRDVDEWVVTNLGYYFSSRKETRAKLKGRDILVLNYRAIKRWDFDPTKLVVDGRAITADDILTKNEYWDDGELPPDTEGTHAVCVPALKPGRTVEIRYGDDSATFEAPRR
ncbi:MAG: hypothetical protein LBT15_05290 [Synergistaceae bacterium]|jgi:hypothetical protein|nr:hypothetical protein [Synergistaceae bacterium]